MSDDRRNLKIHPPTFKALADDKPGGVTWDRYLLDLKSAADNAKGEV